MECGGEIVGIGDGAADSQRCVAADADGVEVVGATTSTPARRRASKGPPLGHDEPGRGPGSVLYGPEVLGEVIHVITRRPCGSR